MRIAQVAPLKDSVPPKHHGGVEQVVSSLTEALVALGHDVTLFASGDSVTRAMLDPVCPRAPSLDPECHEPTARQLLMLERVACRASEFDVIHFHTDWLHMPLFSRLETPFVTTLHDRLDRAESRAMLQEFGWTPLVSVSDAQRKPAPLANWFGTVHPGLPAGSLVPQPRPTGGYLAFLGRLSPDTQAEAAIRIAVASGRRIRIAAKIDPADHDYVRARIKPVLGYHGVDFVGEIDEAQKAEFLGNADALLFPAARPEPFDIALIEAAACGTPVIAVGRGSVPEIVEHGLSGLIVRTEAEAVAAVDQVGALSRMAIRRVFDRRFTSLRMAATYAGVYATLVSVTSSPFATPAARIGSHPVSNRVWLHPRL